MRGRSMILATAALMALAAGCAQKTEAPVVDLVAEEKAVWDRSGEWMKLAQAKESAWYLGASIGQSKFKNDCGASGVSCDMKDTAWKFLGGYQFNRCIAAEGAYTDLGSAKSSSRAIRR